jgi:hypothetical protein
MRCLNGTLRFMSWTASMLLCAPRRFSGMLCATGAALRFVGMLPFSWMFLPLCSRF